MRYAFRSLAKSPGFAAVAIFTLAVGIGANTAVFSVANALLLRPLPYARPDRLVLLDLQRKDSETGGSPLSWPRFTEVSQSQRSFSNLAAFTSENFTLTGRGNPEQLAAARVTWNFFNTLGVRLAAGRIFRPEEDRPGGDNVAIVPSGRWEVGRHLTLDSKDYTVIGVLPPGFQFGLLGANIAVYAPRVFDLNLVTPAQVQAGVGFLSFVARLRDGVSIRQAQAEMDTLSAEYGHDNPKAPDAGPDTTILMGNLQDRMVADVRTAVLILFGAVALVLLIACANVSSLLLSRALGRQREMAVRTAMGAPRGALVRQLLTESLILSLAGGLLGAALSMWGTRALAAMARGTLPLASEIRVDSAVLAFTLAVSLAAGVLFGLAPALDVSRPDINAVLRSEGRGSTAGRGRNLFRNLLVVSQVALSMLLLVGAGLLVRNFIQLRSASPGFDARNLLTMNVTLPPARYSTGPQMIAFFRELVRRVSNVPGVRSAAAVTSMPYSDHSTWRQFTIEGQAVDRDNQLWASYQVSSPEYFTTARVPLRAGRFLTAGDGPDAPAVVLVSEAVVQRYWHGKSPLGQKITIVDSKRPPMTVVGVVGDMVHNPYDREPPRALYVPYQQEPNRWMDIGIRTAGNPLLVASNVGAAIRAIDSEQPVTDMQSMEKAIHDRSIGLQYVEIFMAVFGVLALVLSAVGVYGVMAYMVSEQTHDIGLRMALGAPRIQVLRAIFRRGMITALAGLAVGLPIGYGFALITQSLIYGVTAKDPATFIGIPLLLLAATAVAILVPARRAMSIDPIVALRYE